MHNIGEQRNSHQDQEANSDNLEDFFHADPPSIPDVRVILPIFRKIPAFNDKIVSTCYNFATVGRISSQRSGSMNTQDELKLRFLAELYLHLSEDEQEKVISLIVSILSEK